MLLKYDNKPCKCFYKWGKKEKIIGKSKITSKVTSTHYTASLGDLA